VELYVHIPFCAALCPFCSFHRVLHCPAQSARYFAALHAELRRYHEAGYRFSGVYVGGGTPTLEPAPLLATLDLVRSLFPVRTVSVETNPRELRPPLLDTLAAAGVTRLSVGVQSFDDDLLRAMERLDAYGSGDEMLGHLRAAAGRFPTLNVDLIFNQPRQTLASFARDLATVRAAGADQVSCYPLMSAPGVRRRMGAAMGLPDATRLRAFYATIGPALGPAFSPTSAWCFSRGAGDGDEYLATADHYVGVGSGAFSYLDGTLYATTFSLAHYEERVRSGATGVTAARVLSPVERARYALLVGLFGRGLTTPGARASHAADLRRVRPELAALRLLGALRTDTGRWELTARGRYWLMLMMAEFFTAVNTYREAMRARVKLESRTTGDGPAAPPVAAPLPTR
jgi:coproporphyrinogen III oxidase-like Fe-S oxidoreductase